MAHAVPYEEGPDGKLKITNKELCDRWGLHELPVEIKGRGVFPKERIPAGQLVVKFEGPIYNKETCPEFSEAIQVRQPPRLAHHASPGRRSGRPHTLAFRGPPYPPTRRWAWTRGCGPRAAWTTW